MSTPQDHEVKAKFALGELKQRTDRLRLVKGGPFLKTMGILASLAWLPVLFFGQDRTHTYFVYALVAAIIVITGYIRLTNQRIDDLIKLLGDDKLSK